jgi:hypothetical protein
LHVPFPLPPSEEVQPASSQFVVLPSVLSVAAVVLPQPVNASAPASAASNGGKQNFNIVRVMLHVPAISGPGW